MSERIADLAKNINKNRRHGIPCEHPYRFLIHDGDSIFSEALDQSIANLGIRVVTTPYRSPQANSICERVIGSMRREFLDLGPGVPDPPAGIPAPLQPERHGISNLGRLIATLVLGGLHHEYARA